MKRSKTISVKTAVRKTRKVRLVLAIACSVVLLALNLPATIHADDGDLDPGFGEVASHHRFQWSSQFCSRYHTRRIQAKNLVTKA